MKSYLWGKARRGTANLMVIHRPNHQFIIMLLMIVLEIHLPLPCVKLLHMNKVAAI